MPPDSPVVVVGAGAAGLVAAIFAAERARVVLVERTRDGGRKILISGGGRCNVLPRALEPERFVTSSPPHLLRGMLRSWPLVHQRAFFEETLGIPLALDPATGKVFPASNRARDIRDALVALARNRGVEIVFDASLTSLSPVAEGWRVETTGGEWLARAVILATGGLSVPATGSDGTGLRTVAALGHTVRETYPALTPLVCESTPFAGLAGVSLDVRIRARGGGWHAESSGGFLFTHRGYSGPAVLNVSHVAVRALEAPGERRVDDLSVRLSWAARTPDEWRQELTRAGGLVTTAVGRALPQRLADRLVELAGVPPDRRIAELRRGEWTALVEALTSFVLPATGHEGYKKAEVTGGGVALDEVDPQTLESRRRPGLFLCGEMLDAFGPIGGHNFAWAWATGRAAGKGVGGH